MQDVDQFKSTSDSAEQAEWIKGAIERLENEVGKETSIKIMEICGRECYRKHKRAKQLMGESESIEEFVNKLNIGGTRFKLKDKHTIVGEYNKCYCYMVKQSETSFPTNTYCHCGVGHIKQLFESALKRSVKVELVQPVITGAESCRYIIHI
jgi:predicted hydrocarbon binding protein